MSEQIDWSKAPEWASVRIRSRATPTLMAWSESYTEGVRFLRDDYDGAECRHLAASFWELVAERPTTPSWSGEGLPPVGLVCEYCCVNGQWRQVKVIAHMIEMQKDNPCAVSQLGDTGPLCIGGASSFRQIRTPEQIAAAERDTAVDEMHKLYMEGAKHSGGLYALYDAGFRKP